MPTEPVVWSQSVTCILLQSHRVTLQSVICGGQVSRSLTFTQAEDEWCRKEGPRLSKASQEQVENGTKKNPNSSRMTEKINRVVLSD